MQHFVFASSLFVIVQVLSAQQAAPPMQERIKPLLQQALDQGGGFVIVSAASGTLSVAPESLASAFGSNLAPRTEAGNPPYPTSLGGISLQVVDNAGTARIAPLLYVSPNQINFQVPSGTAAGMATVNIVNGTGVVPSGTAQIQTVAPALFTANGNGQGVVAATAYRTIAPSGPAFPIPVYQCGPTAGSCVSVPIDLGLDTPVTVTLYATGLRGRSSDSAVFVLIGGQQLAARAISSFDSSSPLAGIDQVTFGPPLSLRGSGETDIALVVDGVKSNAGRINIQ